MVSTSGSPVVAAVGALLLLSGAAQALSATAETGSTGFGFNFFSRTNTKNVTLPTTRVLAEEMGWLAADRGDGTVCHPGLGVEYIEPVEGSRVTTRARPLSLFFEATDTGRISAFSVRAWFEDKAHYNPDTWQLPVVGVPEDGERWVTVTTRDPARVCSQGPSAAPNDGALLGDRLLVNVDQEGEELLSIPTTVPTRPDGAFKAGACQADMSRHWGYPLDGNATQLYGFDHGVHVLPVIPMYSVPERREAGVTALAFFTTEAQQTYSQGGIWDATGTPAQLCSGNFCLDENLCEYGEGNSVLHVFFIDQWSENAQCGAGGSPGCPPRDATTYLY